MLNDDPADLAAALRAAAAELTAAGVPSPRADAELLAAHLLGIGLGELRVAALLGAGVPDGFADLVAERARRIPLQHLTGVAHFRRLELAVGPGVFIPRPETEGVAQLVIDYLLTGPAAGTDRPVAIDLGTGSGALAASIAAEVPHSRVYAVELSELAHAWASRNLRDYGDRVSLRLGDLRTAFDDLDGQADVVVSNPPYIPDDAVPNEPEVAEHDPELALYGGGGDGMLLPSAALRSAARLLRPGGYFVMEHAEVQAAAMLGRFRQSGFTGVSSHRDLAGKARATSGYLADAASPSKK
ncbi:peptide chain release factor N(5)-glutamine methyltransferase [Arthrobacter russicus]|uniref:Release factor glutamine methyltransferase n=1 Tax=Arthrobacter russicus TaxID=172040 RepID=A0ABU1JAJ5_9MICC|nr:peptide chain release factor N(5)-glutamine methyltransferase [Arthrobacter russicus]MDN5668197.1 peptide chain release factor N(5)-glutamine methyltransferase [Renibacterium salmoninarum]MDR6268427.1 release factor glutamine methyltransferase [Arthrobacter russicus]